MDWTLHGAAASFDRYRELWDEINAAYGNHIVLDAAFVALLLRHFGAPDTLLAICDDPRMLGVALVERRRRGFWQTFQPAQGPLGLMLLARRDRPIDQVRELIRSLPGHSLAFGIHQQDPEFTAFVDIVPASDVEVVDYITTARLTLTGTFDDYWRSRTHNLTHNLRRQRRRLAEQGRHLQFVADRRSDTVGDAVRMYGQLEGAGWKAEQGTAITPTNRQGLFYRELLEHFCHREEGIIYRLLLDGRTIASNLCLERNGILVILKTTYDESIERLSPGLLLHEDMLRALFAEGKVKVIEYYGQVRDWHQKWTSELRSMYHVNVCRYPWVATTRRLLKRCVGRLSHWS